MPDLGPGSRPIAALSRWLGHRAPRKRLRLVTRTATLGEHIAHKCEDSLNESCSLYQTPSLGGS